MTFVSPEGVQVEVQFHTKASFETKELLNHDFYELSRNPALDGELKILSDKIQTINQEVYVEKMDFNYSEANLGAAANNFKKVKPKIKHTVIEYSSDNGETWEQLEVYEGVDVKKIGGTKIPEKLVLDTDSKILKYGSNYKEALENIEKKYGSSSIQYTTAKGAIIQKQMGTSGIVSGTTAKTNVDHISKVFKRIHEVYENAGIKAKDLTDEFLKNGGSPDAAEKVCANYFKDDMSYWKKSDPLKKSSMKYFTGAGYMEWTDILRNEKDINVIKSTQIESFSKQLLKHGGLSEDMIIYRGLDDLDWLPGCAGKKGSELVKSINDLGGGLVAVKDSSFASATPVLGQGFCEKSIVEVSVCPKGTSGMYIGANSTCPYEVEWLYNAGSGNNKAILGAEQIGNQIFLYTQIVK